MRLRICGSAGSYGSPGKACSSYLLESEETTLLFDCGNGSFSLLSQMLEPGKLDGVFISHRHHDHVADLVSLYHFLIFVPNAFRHKIKLFASTATFMAFEAMFGFDLTEVFIPIEVGPSELVVLGDLHITFEDTLHVEGSLAIRVVDLAGQSVVYTGDASPLSRLSEFASGCDLLIGECTWIHRPAKVSSGLHFDAYEIGALAKAAEVGALMVTHVAYPQLPEDAAAVVKLHFTGPILVATDGMTIQI